MLTWEKIPGSPCFSVLQVTECWTRPGNEAIVTSNLWILYIMVQRDTSFHLSAVFSLGCGLWKYYGYWDNSTYFTPTHAISIINALSPDQILSTWLAEGHVISNNKVYMIAGIHVVLDIWRDTQADSAVYRISLMSLYNNNVHSICRGTSAGIHQLPIFIYEGDVVADIHLQGWWSYRYSFTRVICV